ncbi:MAG: hypothetical protein HN348_08335 [Proteobacteria bacterium]|nr:hypothetical protein [Pseudomonadota bacterium]
MILRKMAWLGGLLGLVASCGLYDDPWQIRLAEEDWQTKENSKLRLHYSATDRLLSDDDLAEAYFDNCLGWHNYLDPLFGAPDKQVQVYIFRDADHWNAVLYSGSAMSGAISTHNRYTSDPAIFLTAYPTVGHEMVHLFTQDDSHPAPGMLFEGLAVIFSGQPDDEYPDFDVPADTNGGYQDIPPHECSAPFAAQGLHPIDFLSVWDGMMHGSQQFYCISASFVKYLVDEEGLDPFLHVLRKAGRASLLGPSVEAVLEDEYGRPYSDLEDEWLQVVENLHPEFFQ